MTDRAELPAGHQQFYGLKEMAMLIALRIKPHGEEMRATVDKVRKRLVYAVRQHELHLVGPCALQLYSVPEVLAWARTKWPEPFADIRVNQEAAAQSELKIGVTVHADVIPGDLEKCQETLQNAYRAIHRLERELATAHNEAERLRPLAERYVQNSEKNRISAKRPRNV